MEHWLIEFLRNNFDRKGEQQMFNWLEEHIHQVPFLEDPITLGTYPHSLQYLKPYLIITTTGLPLIAMCHPVLCTYWINIHTIPELSFAIYNTQVRFISREPLPFTLDEIRPYPHYQNLSMLGCEGKAPLSKGQIEVIESEEKVRQVLENYLTPKPCHSKEI